MSDTACWALLAGGQGSAKEDSVSQRGTASGSLALEDTWDKNAYKRTGDSGQKAVCEKNGSQSSVIRKGVCTMIDRKLR